MLSKRATGVMAAAIAERIGEGHVLGIDRSESAIARAKRLVPEKGKARLEFRCMTAEDFALVEECPPFDLVVAIRVGAFDGRHPELGAKAMPRILARMTPEAGFFIDSGDGLRNIRADWERAPG